MHYGSMPCLRMWKWKGQEIITTFLKYITAYFLTPQVESGEECDPPIDANPVEKKCCTIDCKKVESEQCELSDETRDAALAYPSNDAFYFFQGSHYIKTRSVLLL